MKRLFIIITLISSLSATVASCSKLVPPMVTISGETMGTTYNVKYINLNNQATELSADEMKAKIDKLLINVNQLMSTYIPNSELSLLNKAPKNVAFAISPATQYVIQEALKLNDISEGMLDITVGPLVNQWGFGPTLRANKIPTSEQLKQTMSYVGVDKFTLANNAITKLHPDVYIDLSTIAKGFGVDEVADLLLSEGIKNFLVEIGGEMRVAGKKPNEQNWLIAIEKPITGSRAIQQIVNIGDNAIATSGDYRNYFEENGVRYSHLINPLTGYPIQHNLVSVTVVADKSIEADGLATALMVMGPEKGQALAEKEGIAALFITKELDGFVEKRSLEFSRKVEVILPEKNN